MRFAGIDIGSRTIELVMVDGVSFDRIMATGYGRNLFEIAFDAPTVTEIKAHAKGAGAFFPDIRTVLDIGGQDSKAIALLPNGKVKKFEMNDRCAAGMINRVSVDGEIVFTGGVAKNPCMRALIEAILGRRILSPDEPQLVGALGAAVLAKEENR